MGLYLHIKNADTRLNLLSAINPNLFPMHPFSAPRKPFSFPMFPGGGKRVHWEQMG